MNFRSAVWRLNTFCHNLELIHKQSSFKIFNILLLHKIYLHRHVTRKCHTLPVFIRNYCSFVRENDESRTALLRILSYYGFSEDNRFQLIKTCPEALQLSEEKLQRILHYWTQCAFGENLLISLLLQHPNLLFIHSAWLQNVYTFLSSKFSKNEVYIIFLKAPQSLLEDVEILKDKLEYLEKEMMVSRGQIINSPALGYPLHHLKERHEFLKRVGVFKLPFKTNIGHDNPKLELIVSSSNKDFAIKVAGVSLLEYEVFQQMFKQEEE